MATESSKAAAAKTENLFIQTSECVGESVPVTAHGRLRPETARRPRGAAAEDGCSCGRAYSARACVKWARGAAEVYLRQTPGLAVDNSGGRCRMMRGSGTRHGP